MKQNRSTILEDVYKYYTNEKNYLTESMCEDGGSIVIDDALFGDIMSMVHEGVFEEMEDGCILIPTKSNSTFIIAPNGECYISDNLSDDEHEVQIEGNKLNQIMQDVKGQKYGMVSEGKNSIIGANSDGQFFNFKLKPGTPEEQGIKDVHDATQKAVDRRRAEKEDAQKQAEFNNRFNNPEWREEMSQKRQDWLNRYNPWNQLDLFEEQNEVDMRNTEVNTKPNTEHQAGIGNGSIIKLSENKLRQIIEDVIDQIMK